MQQKFEVDIMWKSMGLFIWNPRGMHWTGLDLMALLVIMFVWVRMRLYWTVWDQNTTSWARGATLGFQVE